MCCFFFFNDTATTEIYTLSLHDALPISLRTTRWQGTTSGTGLWARAVPTARTAFGWPISAAIQPYGRTRSEEHTSELQSLTNLVCRLLLEKKKQSLTLSFSYLKTVEAVS